MAYRVMYEKLIGPCPIGKDPHHRCRNKVCVNPWHLQWLTPTEHARLHGQLRMDENTHCPAGHEYTPENTYHFTRKDGRREKHCRRCRRERWRERHGSLIDAPFAL